MKLWEVILNNGQVYAYEYEEWTELVVGRTKEEAIGKIEEKYKDTSNAFFHNIYQVEQVDGYEVKLIKRRKTN